MVRSVLSFWLLCPLLILSSACSSRPDTSDYHGSWKGEPKEITVRWEPRTWRYLYYTGQVEIDLSIRDNRISGWIGDSKIENVELVQSSEQNGSEPSELEFTAVVNKLFKDDPVPEKELLFLLIKKEQNQLECFIRMGEFGARFDVGSFILYRRP